MSAVAAAAPKAAYTLIRSLGSGAFGKVDLVSLEGNQVAMKTIVYTPLTSYVSTERENLIHSFLSEDDAHPNIVKMFSRGSEGLNTMFFMEFAAGGTLRDQIGETGMEARVARGYYRQLLCGLEYLQLNAVVHMDIKPANLVLTEQKVLKICDFGLARFYQTPGGKNELVEAGNGTPEYAAPEVWVLEEVEGPPLDVWSSGVTLLRMLLGYKPWRRAEQEDKYFVRWMHVIHTRDSYRQLDEKVMDLLRSILTEDVGERACLRSCKRHRWVVEEELEDVDTSEDDEDSKVSEVSVVEVDDEDKEDSEDCIVIGDSEDDAEDSGEEEADEDSKDSVIEVTDNTEEDSDCIVIEDSGEDEDVEDEEEESRSFVAYGAASETDSESDSDADSDSDYQRSEEHRLDRKRCWEEVDATEGCKRRRL